MSEEPARLPAGCDVLLLEDDAPLRRRLTAYLEKLGANVSPAERVAEARRLLAGGRFEFALVDLHLPDGVCQRTKSRPAAVAARVGGRGPGTDGAWSFLPAGARVSLAPSDPVTPDLQRQIDEYIALDRRLKTDVRSLLVTDRRFEPRTWIAAAPREAELEAELETRAEAIRLIVVKFKDPAMLPQVPTVPQSMAAQLAKHRADKAAL